MKKKQILLTIVFAMSVMAVALLALTSAPAQASFNAQATATAPAAQATTTPGEGAQSYAAIVSPGADRLLLLILNLSPDGKAELTADGLNGDAPVAQQGTWQESGDTVTLTLTGEGARTLDTPVKFVFERNGDRLDASEFDAATYGERGLFFTLRDSLDEKITAMPRAYVTLDLAAGFPLDPFFVSVNGGGELDASGLSDECHGYINGNPTVVVNWTGTADAVRAFTYSDADPVLVVQTPGGEFLCGDDASRLALDSQIEISKPAEGRYRIWVGSAEPNQLLPTILVLTARSDVRLSNFKLGDLVKRAPVPEEGSAVPAINEKQKMPDVVSRFGGTVGGPLGETPLTAAISSAGTMAAFELDLGAARCNGYIAETPDYVFEVATAPAEFTVFLSAQQDATLLVVGPDGAAFCNDDSETGVNQNPAVTVTSPQAGRYAVFVGRLDQEAPVQGTLTISTDPDAAPDVLPPQ